jgi:hypothetical protein
MLTSWYNSWVASPSGTFGIETRMWCSYGFGSVIDTAFRLLLERAHRHGLESFKEGLRVDANRYFSLQHGMGRRVNRGWAGFTFFAQIVVGASRVYTLKPSTSNVLIAPYSTYVSQEWFRNGKTHTITDDMGMLHILSRLSSRIKNIIAAFVELHKAMTRVFLIKLCSTAGTTIPVKTLESNSNDSLRAKITGRRVTIPIGIIFAR